MFTIEGRRICLNTQNTQTVKVCTPANQRGVYERYYRISESNAIRPQEALKLKISHFNTLAELYEWLTSDMGAVREPQHEVLEYKEPITDIVVNGNDEVNGPYKPIVAEILEILEAQPYSAEDDPWVEKASVLVEQAIDRLVSEFIKLPYLHRVEHSLHVELFGLMQMHGELAEYASVGEADLCQTQLIHKEWPETVARNGGRRGNFDIAVLSPQLLKTCPSIEAFRHGHLEAPIVIEVGLDYDVEHLANDAMKLLNSKPKHGYLVHLVRGKTFEPEAEKIITGVSTKGIKCACASILGQKVTFKLLNDADMSTASMQPQRAYNLPDAAYPLRHHVVAQARQNLLAD